MIALILWCLILYLFYVIAAPCMQYLSGKASLGSKLMVALGPRDSQPFMSPLAQRAARAHTNFAESLPFFLTLALLLLHTGKADMTGLVGAKIFLGSRVFYFPAYLSGVPGVRSVVWMIGAAGLVMMAVRLVA